eukprot:TRINITY_DN6525_c0_g1_i4.p1 TRINITY_DN6525_c0_g1~~TRINITY_DN6525_c0_g1_i4.p1  ORF type:complete len:128 (-),score=38.63 TRINITY_DN6525_c0_g1_i4:84-467(-)
MPQFIIIATIFAVHLSFSSSFNIHLAVTVDDGQQESIIKPNSLAGSLVAPRNLTEVLVEDLDKSYKNLSHCGFSKILKCTGKVTEAVSKCTNHPDITQCIEEILGANSECKDCIKTICKKLHIHGCQ